MALNMAGWCIASLLADGEKVEADAAMEMEELAHRQPVWRTAKSVEADRALRLLE